MIKYEPFKIQEPHFISKLDEAEFHGFNGNVETLHSGTDPPKLRGVIRTVTNGFAR